MTKRAVLYARVSGDDRGNEGRNLAGQLEMGREYAQENGWEIVAELAEDDRGASGADIDLPQLTKVREMADAGDFDILVVREVDRLSRNLAKQLIVEQELKRNDVEVQYVIGEYPDTPEGRLQKHVKAVLAEYEREKITERVIRGRRQKVKAGNVLMVARPPYGYRVADVHNDHIMVHQVDACTTRARGANHPPDVSVVHSGRRSQRPAIHPRHRPKAQRGRDSNVGRDMERARLHAWHGTVWHSNMGSFDSRSDA
jgi:DNA invertase Pin-like site-specific DNA recombinase